VSVGEILWWLLLVPLGLFGAWVAGCNYVCVYLALVRREHHSLVPLLGGGCVALACMSYPAVGVRSWSWLPLALDPGNWVCVMAGPYLLVIALRRGNRT
jgi:hypothetical protein